MRAIRTSGLMSGKRRRSGIRCHRATPGLYRFWWLNTFFTALICHDARGQAIHCQSHAGGYLAVEHKHVFAGEALRAGVPQHDGGFGTLLGGDALRGDLNGKVAGQGRRWQRPAGPPRPSCWRWARRSGVRRRCIYFHGIICGADRAPGGVYGLKLSFGIGLQFSESLLLFLLQTRRTSALASAAGVAGWALETAEMRLSYSRWAAAILVLEAAWRLARRFS